MKKWHALIAVGLLIGILYQAAHLAGKYGPDLIAIRSNLGKSGQWRGVNFNQSQKTADFIEFLNRNIPENARVVLPSFVGESKILNNPYMQFFLHPREVINCVNVECLQAINREETYIVIAGNLPEDLFQNASYLMFDEQWGLLPPDNHANGSNPQKGTFNSLGAIIRAGLGPLLWLAVLILTGAELAMFLLPGQERLMYIALGYGLGLGLFSMGIAVFDLLGFRINTALILVITGILLGAALISLYWKKRKHRSANPVPNSKLPKMKFDIWPLLFVGLGGIAMILAIGKGYHRIDAIQIWGVKGYGIAADSSLDTVTDWGTNTLAYPLHIPVLIATFQILFGDVLPSSKLIFGGYYLALMMVAYFALLGLGMRRWFSGLAVFVVMTTPIIFRHGTIGYANLPLAFYLLSGVIVYLPIFVGRVEQGNMFLSGLFFACAAWTRPEGLMVSFFCTGLLLLLVFVDKNISLDWRQILRFLAPLVIYFLFWQVIRAQIYPEPLSKTNLTSDALAQIFRGEFHIKEVFFIFTFLLGELVDPNVWGVAGMILLFAGVFVLIFRKYVSRIAAVMIASGGLFLAMIIGMYYLTSFDPVKDLSWWLTSGLNRMIFPGLIVFWLGIIVGFQDILEGSR